MVDQVLDLQDEEFVKCILADQSRMEAERQLYEPIWRDIDTYIDPFGSGGFLQSNSLRDVEDLFDITAIEGLDRNTAAIAGITIPRNQRWQGLKFGDENLNALPNVKRWSEHATGRLFACRYAPHAGFEVQAHEDIRQELKYGTAPLWVDEVPGVSLFYKSLHLSEVYIDENHYGRVDKKHRRFKLSLRNAIGQFGRDNLSPNLNRLADDHKNLNDQFEFIHVLRPNRDYSKGVLGPAGFPIESVYLEIDQKFVIRRKGYRTDPMPVSRHITGPRDKYGRSPAMKVLATVKGVNAMARTILDAANRAVNPPLLFADDADISTLITKPNGLNPGGLDEIGRELVKPLRSGDNIPLGVELTNMERGVIDKSFLGEFFRLLSDPSDRMTATQVLETLQKEGVLIAPFAGRRETEKIGPMIERELDLLMTAGQIAPFPPEVREAGARPIVQMTNPLARMARAEEVGGFTRWVEVGVQAASAGAPEALDRINWDEGMKGVGEVLGVPPSYIHTDDEVAAKRGAREDQEAAAMGAEVAPKVAGAALDLARANELGAQLAAGGGLG